LERIGGQAIHVGSLVELPVFAQGVGGGDRGEDRRDVQLPCGALDRILDRLQIHAERLARQGVSGRQWRIGRAQFASG
jgi:hypothetical protein